MQRALTALVLALAAGPVLADPLDDFLDAHIAAHRIPGLAVAVLKDGEVVAERSFGLANLETETPVGPHSVFELASLSKPFTAAAVMKLVEAGTVGLEDPLSRFLDDTPEAWRAIRVRHLLTHTAGLTEEAIGVCDGLPLLEVPADTLERIIRAQPMLFQPGRGSSYSDPGYFLLGRVIERATGVSYADFLSRTFFEPLGMSATHVQDLRAIVRGRVAPYSLRNGQLLRGRRDWQLELNPQFGVWSSLRDLERWEKALHDASVLRPETLGAMWAPASTDDGLPARVWGIPYGIGWMVGDFNGERLVEHGGFSGTHLLRFPDRGLTVVLLSNLDLASGNDLRRLSREVVGFFAPDLRLPWRLETQPDPDPGLTGELHQALLALGDNRRTGRVSERWWAEIESLPPPVRDRLSARFAATSELRFHACSSVSPRVREQDGVVRVCHFEARSGDDARYYSLSLDADDRVLAAPSWSR